MRKGSVGECAGLLTLLRYMILLAGRSPSQHARPSPFAHRKKEISRRRKKTTCALRVMGAMVASENCHVGPCYVMEALFGISSAYLSSGVSTRGQRRLHHATGRTFDVCERGRPRTYDGGRTIRNWKKDNGGFYFAKRGQTVR